MATFAHQARARKIRSDIEAYLANGGKIRQFPSGMPTNDQSGPAYGHLSRTKDEVAQSRKRGSARLQAHNKVHGHPRQQKGETA